MLNFKLNLKINWRQVLSIFAIAFLISVTYVAVLLIKTRQEKRIKAGSEDYKASFVLAPSAISVNTGENFNLDIVLNTGGEQVVGVDVILNFDKDKLELVGVTPNLTTAFKSFVPSKPDGTFDQDKVKTQANSQGKIEFGSFTFDQASGVINPLATIAFKAKTSGTTEISFYFSGLGATADCNVVAISGEDAVDILQDPAVNKATVTVAGGAATPTPIPPTPSIPPLSPTSPTTPTLTPTPAPGQAGLTFKIKFQGISQQRPAKTVKVVFKNGETFSDVNVVSDSAGIYSGTVSNVAPGTYEVLIKEPSHLQKNFGSIILAADQTLVQDWSANELKAGDFNNDNILNIMDIAAPLTKYTALTVPVDASNQVYDVNSDNEINIFDVSLVLSNYTQLEVHGDE